MAFPRLEPGAARSLAAGRWETSDATTCNRQHYTRVSSAAPPGAPVLLRPLAAAVAMVVALALAWLLLDGQLQFLFVALVAWGFCLVGLLRALRSRRAPAAVLYALGALPVTAGLILVAFF